MKTHALLFAFAFLLLAPRPAAAGEEDPEIAGRPLSAWAAELSDPSLFVRSKAATSIGEAGPAAAPAVNLLALALEDDWPEVRKAALVALASIGKAGAPALEARLVSHENRPGADKALQAAGARAVPLLVALLDSQFWIVRAHACEQLRKIGEEAAAAGEALAARVSDPAPAVRVAALAALVEVGGDALDGVVFGALEDDHSLVRRLAFQGVVRREVGGERRSAILLEAGKSEDARTRLFAIYGLRVKGPEDALRAALHDEDESVRVQAALGLLERGVRDNAIARALLPQLGNVVPFLAWFGGRGGHRNLRAGSGYTWAPPRPTNEEIASALVGLGPAVVRRLVKELEAESDTRRWNAMGLLARIGGDAVKHLVPILESENEMDRWIAAILLAPCAEYRAAAAPVLVEACVESFDPRRSSDHPEVVGQPSIREEHLEQATKLLGKLAVPLLRARLETLDGEGREHVEKLIDELSE
jgi:HEAT repeat protein